MKRLFAAFLMAAILLPSVPARAAEGFDANFILSDSDLTDTRIPDDFAQKFLESRGSGIAKRKFKDLDGITEKSPGDIITYYGKTFGVNPKFLLALIQKEQSLVYDKDPSDCQINWATGYNRPDGSGCHDGRNYGGFTQQIVGAAAFVHYFYEKERIGERRNFGFFPGTLASIDGQPVIPGNVATAMLYTYTPHLHGNRLLLKLWSEWFTSSYPDGSYLAGPDGKTYLIQGGLKRLFVSKSALYSRVEASRVIKVGVDVLARYEDGASIKFADYSLLRVPSGTVYLIVRDLKRPIASMEVFRTIGFNPEEIDDVDPADLEAYADGETITVKSSYPTGALLQDNKSGGVYYVENGVKYPIYSAEIMKTNYPSLKLKPVAKSVLDLLPNGAPVKFRDGELVTSPGNAPAVFVISNGQRRPIVSGEAFEKLGYSWSRLIRTNDTALGIHPLGPNVDAVPAATPTTLASN
jgi:hypothetical protein